MDQATARTRALIKFWPRVDKRADSGCWEWTGPKLPTGYGYVTIFYRKSYTHRLAYEITRGPIPDEKQIDHLCRNRACCNPDHLEAVTIRTNQLRSMSFSGINGRKTHCIRNHEFTPDNILSNPARPNRRGCRTCRNERRREATAKRLAA